jgi:hypothetical protein
MHWGDCVDRLDFDNDFAIDDQISSETHIHSNRFVNQQNRLLPRDC